MTNWNNNSKNSSTFANQDNVNALSYLTTNAPDFILVGTSEDETLILWGDISWSNAVKN